MTDWPITNCLDKTGTINYGAVVGGCRMFLFCLNLIFTLKNPSVKMRMGIINKGCLKIIDASNLLKLTTSVTTVIGLARFQFVIRPPIANRLEVSSRRK